MSRSKRKRPLKLKADPSDEDFCAISGCGKSSTIGFEREGHRFDYDGPLGLCGEHHQVQCQLEEDADQAAYDASHAGRLEESRAELKELVSALRRYPLFGGRKGVIIWLRQKMKMPDVVIDELTLDEAEEALKLLKQSQQEQEQDAHDAMAEARTYKPRRATPSDRSTQEVRILSEHEEQLKLRKRPRLKAHKPVKAQKAAPKKSKLQLKRRKR